MKISEAWLREWVDPQVDTAALAEQLTMAGLEVDGLEPVAGKFTGVVVGEITAVAPHPDADKLRVCQVNSGSGETAQVVCGAPNARQGIKVPFATVGAVLPGDASGKEFKIKKAKLRGVESFGMLCAQTELQAGDDDSGLWELPVDAPVGKPLQEYLQLQDTVIEVDLTPNRGDCLSIRGIAREVGVLNRLPVTEPMIEAVKPTIDEQFPLTVAAAEQCPRYIGRVIRDLDPSRPSPLWLQERLRRAGVRPHDCVVDVTNYVLTELGQPLHAFDLDKLVGGVQVRLAKDGETIQLLDGQTKPLKADTLVIADDEGPIAMAGIMGGERSSVTATTRHIFLESAFFAPLALAGRARSYGLHTDASHRYERGVDYQLPQLAIERATALLTEIAGGQPGPLIVRESQAHLPTQAQVELRRARIASGLGFSLPDQQVEDILTRLGLTKQEPKQDTHAKEQGERWMYSVPSYRFDIAIEEDLLEELARIYGYNQLPTQVQPSALSIPAQPEGRLPLHKLKDTMVVRGYQEAITYSFVGEALNQLFDPEGEPVPLQNPLSADLAVMRTGLWPGLVQAVQRNVNRQQARVRLFETGMRFRQGDNQGKQELEQTPMIAGVICGTRLPENWASSAEPVDFYDLKGDVEALLAATGVAQEFVFAPAQHPALHPGQCAEVRRAGRLVGYLGALHPQLQQQLDLAHPVYLFELKQADLLVTEVPAFSEISRYPEVRRDIAVLVDKSVQVGDLLARVREVAGEALQDLKVFDLYAGKGIDPQRKSVALGLTFQHPSRTLNDSEINASVDAVVNSLKEEYNAELR